jgi:predicted secreted Zn-dependent protease
MAQKRVTLASILRAATAVAVVACGFVGPTSADVRTSTTHRSYAVGGSSASSLVSYMRSRPMQGDHGNAVANVHPTYSLNVATRPGGGVCRATSVALHIRFVMTLPSARTSSMASGTRAAWNAFAAYARQHEAQHRSIYVQCGNAFVAKARSMSAADCGTLQASIRRLLETEKRLCERRQLAFDRAERGRIAGLSLFRLAGGSRSRR